MSISSLRAEHRPVQQLRKEIDKRARRRYGIRGGGYHWPPKGQYRVFLETAACGLPWGGEWTFDLRFKDFFVLNTAHAGSLLSGLQQIPDSHGAHGRRHSLSAMLATIVCAVFCGARGFYAIVQWSHAQLPEVF
ncbi:transposase family protein [Aeoliella straminimaris]|uniref:transposase family protein n=1 Tax=Aeoliella straminimaris TaxID=2954799 RepID=UPI003CC53624